MTDNTQIQDKTLEQLKAQADELGLTYAKNATAKTLKKLIAEELLKDTDADISGEIKAVEDENLKLVNVIVTPVNPQKQSMSHETFQVGNSVLGTIKRIVPMGKPWLVENIIYKNILEKEYQLFIEHDDPKNPSQKVIESRLVPAYNVQVLPLPTQKEIDELAKRQAARDAVN
ncbi:hypothetical protein [Moraxella sp. ZY200743]|uniref:hypothetical protein n=1 Tax=Moraxella sp. ZY200743 TaxID=2911970 RepID=UPI003D7E3857